MSLKKREQIEIINSETLYNISVFAVQSSVFWMKVYEISDWFRSVYQFFLSDDLSELISAQFLQKCLDYCINENFRLWVNHRELHLLCISESKVVATLYKAHDQSGHWVKDSVILKLQGLAYWSVQFTDIEHYIAGCLHCAHYASA